MNLSFIDRIWRIKGSLALEPSQSTADAFTKLAPLFETDGTVYKIDGNTLTYRNKNPAAQNQLATFNRGKLRVVSGEGRSNLLYDLTSPALLFCFLAPLLFLAFGQLILALGEYERPAAEAAEKAAEAKKKKAENKAVMPMNPIDKLLGAPAPEKPKKDDPKDKEKGKNKRSPTSAYVFAGLFATLYLVGRILEPWLIRRTFRKGLVRGASVSGLEMPTTK